LIGLAPSQVHIVSNKVEARLRIEQYAPMEVGHDANKVSNKPTAIQRDGRRARFFMPLELKTGRVPKEGYTAAHRAQVCVDQSNMCFPYLLAMWPLFAS
jgi:hypothetical protein